MVCMSSSNTVANAMQISDPFLQLIVLLKGEKGVINKRVELLQRNLTCRKRLFKGRLLFAMEGQNASNG